MSASRSNCERRSPAWFLWLFHMRTTAWGLACLKCSTTLACTRKWLSSPRGRSPLPLDETDLVLSITLPELHSRAHSTSADGAKIQIETARARRIPAANIHVETASGARHERPV